MLQRVLKQIPDHEETQNNADHQRERNKSIGSVTVLFAYLFLYNTEDTEITTPRGQVPVESVSESGIDQMGEFE